VQAANLRFVVRVLFEKAEDRSVESTTHIFVDAVSHRCVLFVTPLVALRR
jgi:hypothetical protein